jgi:hypothetical protein
MVSVVEFELFAAFPDFATFITSKQFRHDSNYYAWTVWTLAMKATVGFRTSATIHLNLGRRIYRNNALRNTKPQNFHGLQHRTTSQLLLSVNDCGNLYTVGRRHHLWEKIINTCLTMANALILVAVRWLIYIGEMEVYLHDFLISARVVSDRWASRGGFFTPGNHWQLAGGSYSHFFICFIRFLQCIALVLHTRFTN